MQVQPGLTFPSLQVAHDIDPAPVKRSYPLSGTSAMLPLDPSEWADILYCTVWTVS